MSATSIQVSRQVDAPAKKIFDLLSNPERHHEFDGSGMIVSDDKTDRVAGVGDVFTMNMHAEVMGGDYKTENHVTGFDEGKLISWQTAPEGTEPLGWEWVWELESQGSDSTVATLTYDWSKMDAGKAQKLGMPAVPEKALESSLEKLASAVAGS